MAKSASCSSEYETGFLRRPLPHPSSHPNLKSRSLIHGARPLCNSHFLQGGRAKKRPPSIMAAPKTPQVISGRFWRGRCIEKNSQKTRRPRQKTPNSTRERFLARPSTFLEIRLNSTAAPKTPRQGVGVFESAALF